RRVPQLDRLVVACRDERFAVHVPGQRTDCLRMALDGTALAAGLHVPKADCAIHADRSQGATVGREDNGGYESAMSCQDGSPFAAGRVPEMDFTKSPRGTAVRAFAADC